MRLQVAPFRLRCLPYKLRPNNPTLLRIGNSRVHSPIGNVERTLGSRCRFAADWSSLSLNNRQIESTERLRLSSATASCASATGLARALSLSCSLRINERMNERLSLFSLICLARSLLVAEREKDRAAAKVVVVVFARVFTLFIIINRPKRV